MKKKLVLVTILIICLAVGGGFVYIQSKDKKKDSNIPQNNAMSEKTQDEGGVDKDVKNPQVSKEPAQITISSISQDAGMVYVRTVVEGVAQGNCILEFQKQGAQTVSRTTPLVPITSYHACDGFGISKQELMAKGEWKISVKLENSNSVAEKTFNVN